MEFSLESIHRAQNLFTGPDFPKLVREYRKMGIVTNIYNIEIGLVIYENKNGKQIKDSGIKVNFEIIPSAVYIDALLSLQKNQKGESDFLSFCNEIGKAGIYKWVVNLENMTCNYYDKKETIVISENVPYVD